ncbi:MAG: manganese efflux pump, partial [Clostridia bacterium]|nr:manganese efflux pump [Clostridia bacterium]
MGFIELLLIAVGLSMDAFAVALCRGLNMRKINYRHAVIVALFFGGFQALMPLIGFLVGTQFEQYIVSVDHWIVFALLLFIGGKMICEAVRGEEDDEGNCDQLNLKQLFIMAIATSVDALAVGISFAFLRMKIAGPVTLIGMTTFLLSFFGVVLGNRFGSKYQKKAEIAGGIILILIGTKILLEH